MRTIIDKRDGLDRATAARLKRILPDKLAAALKEAEGLRKELKGLDVPTRSNRR